MALDGISFGDGRRDGLEVYSMRSTNQRIIIWGGRGHAKVVHEFLPALGYQVVAVFDNAAGIPSPLKEIPIFFGRGEFDRWLERAENVAAVTAGGLAGVVAIGGSHGGDRVSILRSMRHAGLATPTLIHPTAFVAHGNSIGFGCQILALAAVCADAVLGEGCIVNTHATVEHECELEEGVHVAPGATLTGCVTVGKHAFIGAGSVVLPRLRIGEGVIIGAGSVVTKDIPPHTVAYGNPARVVRTLDSGDSHSDPPKTFQVGGASEKTP